MPKKLLTSFAPRKGLSRRLDATALVSASGEIVDRLGLDGLTLAVLADAASVKPPSLYAHIDSLQALRRKIAAFGLTELEIALARATIGKSGTEAVQALCQAYRGFAKKRPGVYAATVFWIDSNNKAITSAGATVMATVLKITSPNSAGPPSATEIHLVRLMRIVLHGFVTLEAASAFMLPVSIEDTFARTVEMLVIAAKELNTDR